ncbi:MAG: response regulator [Synechococcus sp.]
MDREAQQRIMGFFIEEARDHLVNLEQGLLSLQESASDAELINELFRGAHSIKGGAAMLGISSIQHTAHRMEDTFKVFREREVPVDRKLETLLLRCYDTLASLFDKLQSDEGLSPEDGDAVLSETEPIFQQLDLHMKVLLGELSPEAAAAQIGAADEATPAATKKAPALQDVFQQYVTRLMREMLDLFKQSDSADTRSRLRDVGQSLAQLGDTYELPTWSQLCETIDASLANPANQFPPLARQILPALKQAQKQVLAGEAAAIQISAELQAMATAVTEISLVPISVVEDVQPVPEDVQSAESQGGDLADLWGRAAEAPVEAPDSLAVPAPELLATDDRAEESGTSLNLELASTDVEIDPLTAQPTSGLTDLFGVEDAVDPSDDLVSSDISSLFAADEDNVAESSTPLDVLDAEEAVLPEIAPDGDVGFADLFTPDETELAVSDVEASSPVEARAESTDDSFEDLFSEPEPLQVDALASDFDFTDDLGEAAPSVSVNESDVSLDELDLGSMLSEPASEDPLDVGSAELLNFEHASDEVDSSTVTDSTASSSWDDLDGLFDDAPAASAPTSAQVSPVSSPLPESSPSVQPQVSATQEEGEADPFAAIDEMMEGGSVGKPRAASAPAARASAAPRRSPTKAGFSSPTMRVEVKYLDLINNLVGEMVVSRNSLEQNQARLQQFLENLLFRVRQLGDIGQKMRDRYERSLLEASLLRSTNAVSRPTTNTDGSDSHATGADFDALEMDRFTAFHSLSQEIIELIVRVRESASDIQFVVDQTEQTARQFRQSTSQLQDNLNRARMVPFSQIADRLPRAIRDLSFKTGKQIDLLVDGRDTLIDKAILEELYDPMTHLVNNAIVHGIEEPQVREKSGKAPEGLIKIQTFYQGNQTIIVVSDDGHGIDAARVKEKALAQGLLSEKEAASISDNELYDIIFHAGFSTRSQADELAGRGVGMDVVRTRLNDLRGTVQVDSVPGQGTTFTIRLPLTLSVSKAMVCVSDKALIAFPLDGVEEMVDISLDSVRRDAEGNSLIDWQDQELILKPLAELFSYGNRHSRGHAEVYSSSSYSDDVVPIIILQSGGQRVAVQVDSFVEEQEIVIKQLSGPAPKPLGIAGATVLGDGRVLAIADTLELIDLAYGRTRRDQMRFWMPEGAQDDPVVSEDTTPTVLIVDDSITVRELLSMSFNKVGYKVEQARDGQDAWDKLRNGLPCDLIFCDIEMPRMDGLELLSRMRKEEQYQDLPIAMLTSRGADRHRQMASDLGANAYFTKPYLEEELLTAAKRLLSGESLLEAAVQAEPSQA